MKRKAFFGLLALALAGATGIVRAAPAAGEEALTLVNEHWRVVLEPRWGARASSMVSLADGYDYVASWPEVRQRSDRESRFGGAFRGMISGTYWSAQPDEPYEVLESSATAVRLGYENRYPLLEGLHEERRVALEGRDVLLSVRVTNRSGENRTVAYRFHDFTGIGRREGRDSIYVIPWKEEGPTAFIARAGEGLGRHFIAPAGNWFALADAINDRGLLVAGSGPVAGFFFWAGSALPVNPAARTSETFFPWTPLAPGESWETEIRFTAFSPRSPETGRPALDAVLSADALERSLAAEEARRVRTVPPFDAEMSLPSGREAVVITPVHGASPRLGGAAPPDYGRTLDRIHLSGTPGEVAAFAFAVTAAGPVADGTVAFGDLLSGRRRRIARDAFEPRYVAGESQVLVRDWTLAGNIPLETISHTNNDVVDAAALTSFSLAPGETAWVWTRLRIPDNAAPGRYLAACTVETGDGSASFEIALRVRPFRLLEAAHKACGTFFDYHLRPLEGEPEGRNAPFALSREEFHEVMRVFRDIGFRTLAVYLSSREDQLWFLERAAELGMNGGIVFISPYALTPGDIAGLEIPVYGFAYDQPDHYWTYESQVLARYRRVLGRGLTPVMSVAQAWGLMVTEHMDQVAPIINMTACGPHLMPATGRYKDQGRHVWWYSADGVGFNDRPVERRAMRGIYLWKEPADGFLDWDNSSNRPNLSGHHYAGFAGAEVLPRVALENVRQALIDLDYLHTLETLAGRPANRARRAEAEELLDWVRRRFDSDYHGVLPYIEDPQYLDFVRQRVADMIEQLVR